MISNLCSNGQPVEEVRGKEFFREYTSSEAVFKYTRATAGYGINYLLDHDYKAIYLQAIRLLPEAVRKRGLRILEFGCGGGMNLLHLLSVLQQNEIPIEQAVGTDFSSRLIKAARREAQSSFRPEDLERVEFCQAKNETLLTDLSVIFDKKRSELQGGFDFIFGVNTIRYCHDAGTEDACVRDIFELLIGSGVCVTMDMNDRFPLFRSDLKNRFRRSREKECYVPTLEEYAEPFIKTGFEVVRKDHFCWIPHSSGPFLAATMRRLSPILNRLVPGRAMRSLVIARKPSWPSSE